MGTAKHTDKHKNIMFIQFPKKGSQTIDILVTFDDLGQSLYH